MEKYIHVIFLLENQKCIYHPGDESTHMWEATVYMDLSDTGVEKVTLIYAT
jgi:hypothetical protein